MNSKHYEILDGELKGRILSTVGCIQTMKNKIYGYIGWTPYLINKKGLKEIVLK